MVQIDFAVSDDGLLNFFDDVPEAVDRYEILIREVQLAEAVGFKYHFMIEHQNVHFGQIQSPMVYLSALAQRTSTIRFAQLVLAVPFYHPMRFAMDTAMIDQLSRGRLEVGVGSGADQFEFDRWNLIVRRSARKVRTNSWRSSQMAWTEECVTYHGKYWQLDNAIALPRPYQKPHPPVWFAGRSKKFQEWGAANNANYGNFCVADQEVAEAFDEYRLVCGEAGYTPENMPRNYLHRSVYVAETDEQAYEQIAPYLPECWKWGENKYDSIPNLGYFEGGFASYETTMRGMRTGIDYWLDNNLAYVGSPETVIQRIRESQKLTGFNILGGRFRFGAMSDEMVMNSIRLFGEKVIPAFAEVAALA